MANEIQEQLAQEPMMHEQNETTTPSDDERVQRRREQDLECLTLLQQAHGLRMETAYIDRMLAALRESEDEDSAV